MKKDINYNIKDGYELQDVLLHHLEYKYSQYYFHIEYLVDKYKRVRIVFYNANKKALQYDISCSGNISILIEGFNEDNSISKYMMAHCIKDKEIKYQMNWKDTSGNINKIVPYIISKFKNLDLEKITDSTRHMTFDKVEEKIVKKNTYNSKIF